jgi:NADH-quinone oxidoreductase subunit D
LLEVAMGPQHPSTHGVFRMDVVLDGETVVKLKPVFGYLHRNHEKSPRKQLSRLHALHRPAGLYLFDDQQLGLRLSVEKLAGPGRAGARRIHPRHHSRTDPPDQSRLPGGISLQDMGALGTPLMYAFREREKILDLFESLSGARMMCNYMRFGGCRCDLPPAG